MKLLQDRARTHGDYAMTAKTSQILKEIIRNSPSYDDMDAAMRESMEMIAVKMARIMCGDPFERDHYTDIAGYATLIVQELDHADP